MRVFPPSLIALMPRWVPTVVLAVTCAIGLAACGRTLATAPPAETGAALLAGANPRGSYELHEVAVLPRPNVDLKQLASDYGAVLAKGTNHVCVRFEPGGNESPQSLATRLGRDPRVVVAEPNAVVETAETRQESYASDDGFGSLQATVEQPATRNVGLDAAHRVSQGDGVRVAVLDTGVDPDHPLLASRIAGGYDYVDYDRDPTDARVGRDDDGDGVADEAYGHGTHVAGIIALTAPRARLLVIRVLGSDGRGDIATVTAGMYWALDHGADVINLSLGVPRPSRCIEYMMQAARGAGVIVVCSAGNSGRDRPVEYPAASEYAIAVAATDAWARPAAFSSYGRYVSLSAPGVGVRSAFPSGEWRLWSGTSMSAPFVSGAASLLLALHPEWGREEVMRRLGSTARRLAGPVSQSRIRYGRGMLDVAAALAAEHTGISPAARTR
jgi:subtilisin family serine protease